MLKILLFILKMKNTRKDISFNGNKGTYYMYNK